jgi:hypothetical protein
MSGLLRDLQYAARQLRKNPGFTAVGVIALALGVGLSTTIFSIFYNGVLNPFPYRDANRLTVIGVLDTSHGSETFSGFADRMIMVRTARGQSIPWWR